MDRRLTTRCCSAVALTVAFSASVWAQKPTPRPHPEPRQPAARVDKTPLTLTPVDTVWALALNNELTMPPAYDGTLAFFPIEGDRLVAYDLITGERTWLVTAKPTMAPVAGGGLIYLVEAGTIRALHVADGSLAWELPFADPLAIHPVWDNGWLVLAATTGEVRALRATDGHLIWTRDLQSAAHAAPALAADRVYVPTTDGRVVALRVESGEPLWERRLGGAPDDILALDDRLFVGALDNWFYCVMAASGRVDWRWRAGGDFIGRPVADGRLVYYVALDNVLRAMNLVTGGQQWMRPLPIRPAWGPAKAGATIVVAGQSAVLRAYNSKDGVAAGTLTGAVQQPPEAEPTSAPAPDAGDVPAAKKAPLPFLSLAPESSVAAEPYVLEDPATHMPLMLMVFKGDARGASATLVTHSIEPPIVPAVAALPNLIQIAPVAPTTPPPRH